MLWFMNWGHGKMAKWGLQYLTINDKDRIPDIGCGGGANISRILKKAFEKPDGTFFICNEAVRLDSEKSSNEYFVKLLDLKIYSPQDFTDILTGSGFTDIKINLSKDKKLVCVTAKKAQLSK